MGLITKQKNLKLFFYIFEKKLRKNLPHYKSVSKAKGKHYFTTHDFDTSHITHRAHRHRHMCTKHMRMHVQRCNGEAGGSSLHR